MVTLLPGEATTFSVTQTGGASLSLDEWSDLLVAGTGLVVQR
jgi:hypothetical protein